MLRAIVLTAEASGGRGSGPGWHFAERRVTFSPEIRSGLTVRGRSRRLVFSDGLRGVRPPDARIRQPPRPGLAPGPGPARPPMFHQLLTPIGHSLALSFLVAVLPVVTILVLLGVLRRPAWQAALAGLAVGLVIAVTGWDLPVGLAVSSALNGAVFALWPVMWIVVTALLLYNVAVVSGRFDAFRIWVLTHLPNDRRVSWWWSAFASARCWKASRDSGPPWRSQVRS